MITYQVEKDLDPAEFRAVLINSTLGERRPVDDKERIKRMVAGSNLVVTARDGERLVGVARSVSDFAYCTYLSDLAVLEAYQRQGIGKALIVHTKRAAPQARLILLSAPKAIGYYPKIGMKRHGNCFYIEDIEELSSFNGVR